MSVYAHPELVPLMNALYAQEWSQFTNYFKPTFKLRKREPHGSKTKRFMRPSRRCHITTAAGQSGYSRSRQGPAAG